MLKLRYKYTKLTLLIKKARTTAKRLKNIEINEDFTMVDNQDRYSEDSFRNSDGTLAKNYVKRISGLFSDASSHLSRLPGRNNGNEDKAAQIRVNDQAKKAEQEAIELNSPEKDAEEKAAKELFSKLQDSEKAQEAVKSKLITSYTFKKPRSKNKNDTYKDVRIAFNRLFGKNPTKNEEKKANAKNTLVNFFQSSHAKTFESIINEAIAKEAEAIINEITKTSPEASRKSSPSDRRRQFQLGGNERPKSMDLGYLTSGSDHTRSRSNSNVSSDAVSLSSPEYAQRYNFTDKKTIDDKSSRDGESISSQFTTNGFVNGLKPKSNWQTFKEELKAAAEKRENSPERRGR